VSVTLSVVVPTRDKLSLLQRTLGALEAQTLPAEAFEVVVVDDASSDGTAAWLADEAEAWGGRLRVVSPDRNLGRAGARNAGANAATGEWLLFLDDDIIAPPALLDAHVALLAGHPGCGVIGLVRTDPALVDGPHFHYIDTRGVAKVRGETVPARYLVTQNTSLPRAAFLAVGGFDEGFTAYGFEDMDLGFRLEDAQGLRFLALRDPVPAHIHHHDFDAWLDKKRECGRGPLQHLAAEHPGRLAEMRLDLVLDVPGAPRAPARLRLARAVARSPLSRLLAAAARGWPTTADHMPRMASLHARLLDGLVLSAYCQGLAEHDHHPAGN